MENVPEYIEAYFKNSLTRQEKKEFEKKIIEDKDFAEKVSFYLSVKMVLQEEIIAEKKKWFRELVEHQDFSSTRPQIVSFQRLWVYAAAAAVIFFIFLAGYLFLTRPVSPSHLAGQYIDQNLRTLPVTMGPGKDGIEEALHLYNDGRLNSSLKLFETILQRDTSNISAKKYAGIIYLRIGNYQKALEYFTQLEQYTSLYSNPGNFFHALTLMKRDQPGDKQKVKQLLEQIVQKDLEGKETARQWLKKW